MKPSEFRHGNRRFRSERGVKARSDAIVLCMYGIVRQ